MERKNTAAVTSEQSVEKMHNRVNVRNARGTAPDHGDLPLGKRSDVEYHRCTSRFCATGPTHHYHYYYYYIAIIIIIIISPHGRDPRLATSPWPVSRGPHSRYVTIICVGTMIISYYILIEHFSPRSSNRNSRLNSYLRVRHSFIVIYFISTMWRRR